MKLSSEQYRVLCPFCMSPDIEVTCEMDWEAGTRPIVCLACDKSWAEQLDVRVVGYVEEAEDDDEMVIINTHPAFDKAKKERGKKDETTIPFNHEDTLVILEAARIILEDKIDWVEESLDKDVCDVYIKLDKFMKEGKNDNAQN